MSKEINIISCQTTSTKAAGGATGSGSSPEATGVSKHSMLDGIVSTADDYSEFSREIHLAAPDADTLKRLSTIEVLTSTDKETPQTDENVYSALRAKQEDEKVKLEMEDKYIRKDKPDETDFRVDFHDGITTGRYVGGFLGDGAQIDKNGNAEMSSLSLRNFLEVPELRFNRIDVVSGELWNAIVFGLIESVDEEQRIVKLKLEEGELSGLHVNDFCRGIFHNLTGNAAGNGVDDSGFEVMVGFSTAYFTPVEIIDNATFKYDLKPGSTVHPCKAMKFAVYGNPVEKDRQASAYQTRTYMRYLVHVNTWQITSGNVAAQFGDLSNLIIAGQQLEGGSIYLNNVYFGGHVMSVKGIDNPLQGKDAYSVTLSSYNAVYNMADGITGEVAVVAGDKTVTTGTDQVMTSDFNVSTRIQVTKGAEPLRYSETIGTGKYIVNSTGTGCSYQVTDGMLIVREVTENKAEIRMEVNCEGMAIYEVVFTIVRVADGADGKDYEYIYTRTEKELRPATPATNPADDFVPATWTDDPVGPTLAVPFEWISKRVKVAGAWGNFSTPALWAKFGEDGTEHEYIYCRTSTGKAPSLPPTSQADDFVPAGWTDDPVGVDQSLMYEWVSKRSKVKEKWGDFSTPALWAKFGKDGFDGKDGKDFEFVFCRTATEARPATPPTSQSDDFVPAGWTDDAAGPIGSLPYEWVCKRIKVGGTWGIFSTPSLWSKYSFNGEDGNDGQDGKGIEFIFKRQNTVTPPATPLGENRDDFVPAGWTDDQQGVTGSLQYEFVSKRVKSNGVWGLFSAPSLWAKFSFDGADGQDGKDGTDYEYIFTRTTGNSRPSTPPTSQTDDFVPSGWTDDPVGVTSAYIYEWVSKREKINGTWSVFSAPALWAKYGFDGQPGQPGTDGRYSEDRYRRAYTQPETPSGSSPSGWSLDPPSGAMPLWSSRAAFNANGTLYRSWSVPIRITGETGLPGFDGKDGVNGKDGVAGPAITFRGDYLSTNQYVGNSFRVEVVKYNLLGVDQYYITKTTAGPIIGIVPTDTTKWTLLEGQFESIATGLLIAEEANISGWRFRNNYIESQESNVVLDGTSDTGPRIALGATYKDRHTAPTRLYDDGSIHSNKLFVEDGCYVGTMKIEDGWMVGNTNGGPDDRSNMIKLRHTKVEDGSYSLFSAGSNLDNSLWSRQRVTARIYNGISNKSEMANWGYFYRNTALQLESNFADVNLALETIGGRMHRGRLWEAEEITPITGGGTYNPLLNGSVYLFRDLKADLTFSLPSHSTIQSMFGNFQSGVSATRYGVYTIRVFVDRACSYRILVAGTSTTPLLNQNGDIQNDASGTSYGARWMGRGDFAVLVYYNEAWYIQCLSY